MFVSGRTAGDRSSGPLYYGRNSGRKIPDLHIFEFHHCYDLQIFENEFENSLCLRYDLSMLQGTNGYCDKDAERNLEKILDQAAFPAIHFWGTGNYHYLTALKLKRISEPFVLVSFDHHTDMQPAVWGELLSCGGWILDCLEKNRYLEKAVVVGPEVKSAEAENDTGSEKVVISGKDRPDWEGFFDDLLVPGTAVYITVDKDILAKQDAVTNWDQGNLALADLLRILSVMGSVMKRKKLSLLGADICGEIENPSLSEAKINFKANCCLTCFFLDLMREENNEK